jgi:hypothetical protein
LATAWENFGQKFTRYRRTAFLLLFSLVLLQAVQAVSLLERMTLGASYVWRTGRGKLPADTQYLAIIPYYPAIEFINTRLPEHVRIAFLGEDRTFYIKRPFLASSLFDQNQVLNDFLASPDAATWAERLRRRGVTHILYTPHGLVRMGKSSTTYQMSPAQRQRLANTLNTWPKLYDDGRYFLYQVDL